MCNPCKCCFGKKRRKKKNQKAAEAEEENEGPVETSQITMAPEQRSNRIVKNLSNPEKLNTVEVTEIFQIPSKDFATVAELIASQGYQLGDEIGRGQFGVVYQAKRLRDSALVACKIIEPQKTDARISAKNELFVLQRLSERGYYHPHIIRLYSHFVVDFPKMRQVYIFMQLAYKKSLSDITKSFHNGQPLEVCKRLFAQITSAVNFMHQKGIAHRDLKLNNVLVDQPDLSKAICAVTDFGLSRVSRKKDESVLRSNTAAGTKQYMSPEILMVNEYSGDYDPFLADAWALGVILYRLIYREYPFDDSSPGVIELMLAKKIKPGSRMVFTPSADLTELVERLLEPAVEKRLTVDVLAKHPWFAAEMATIEETVPKAKDVNVAKAGVQEESTASSTSQQPPSSSPSPVSAAPNVATPVTAGTDKSTTKQMPKVTANTANPPPALKNAPPVGKEALTTPCPPTNKPKEDQKKINPKGK